MKKDMRIFVEIAYPCWYTIRGPLLLFTEQLDKEIRNTAPRVISSRQIVGTDSLHIIDGRKDCLTLCFPLAVHGIMQVFAGDDSFVVFTIESREPGNGDGDWNTDEEQN